MRIAIITNSFPTLSETFIYNKVKMLALRNIEVIVFAGSKNEQLFAGLFVDVSNVSVVLLNKKTLLQYVLLHPYLAFAKKKIKHTKQNILQHFRANAINRCKADIIHFEFSGIALEYLPIIDKLKGKKIISCRGTAEKVKLLTDPQRKMQLQILFDKADAIHCVSADMQQTVLPFCMNMSKLFINHPSIDTDYFVSRSTNKKNKPILILSIGRLTFQKGYLTGLLAIKRLVVKSVDFKWLIVGSGIQHEEIIFHIHQLQLHNYVELAGSRSREEIKELMQNTGIFFLPSVYEGIANVALEAMSMELPVVATNCSGMPEVITHAVNGLLANVYDDEDLAAQLLYLINNPDTAKKIGLAARETIINKYALQKQTDIFINKYQELLN